MSTLTVDLAFLNTPAADLDLIKKKKKLKLLLRLKNIEAIENHWINWSGLLVFKDVTFSFSPVLQLMRSSKFWRPPALRHPLMSLQTVVLSSWCPSSRKEVKSYRWTILLLWAVWASLEEEERLVILLISLTVMSSAGGGRLSIFFVLMLIQQQRAHLRLWQGKGQ